jgi:hypothetical protein
MHQVAVLVNAPVTACWCVLVEEWVHLFVISISVVSIVSSRGNSIRHYIESMHGTQLLISHFCSRMLHRYGLTDDSQLSSNDNGDMELSSAGYKLTDVRVWFLVKTPSVIDGMVEDDGIPSVPLIPFVSSRYLATRSESPIRRQDSGICSGSRMVFIPDGLRHYHWRLLTPTE